VPNNIDPAATGLVLVSAALVMVMTPGLAFFYGGLVRRKNVLSIMMQSFISMGIVTAIWVFGGFSLAFGKDVGGLIGDLRYFALNGVGFAPLVGQKIPMLAFFVFQEMFAIITPALITGAFADRVNFKSYLIFLIFWSILIYIPLVHWVWGGGFLAKLGVADFAGGTVVHTSAGFAALATVFIVGKRKIQPGEKTQPHNIT
jgi:Amt family ammonium transporter